MDSLRQIPTLVVDDSPAFLRAFCTFLQQQPNLKIVATARDGREALALAEKLQPELILLDVQMPGMNGVEAARQLGAQCPATCVVMVTALDAPELRQACLQCGARAFIHKNVVRQELPPLLQQVFGAPDA
jgi:two-component system, chemotaxis family, protein-glutamate methylesterase/glutaminase